MKTVVIIVVIGALGYGGYLFAKPYVTSHFLQSQMQGLADKADLKTDREIVTELVAFSQERGLPLDRRDFKVKRYDGRTYISVSYKQVVEVPWIKKQYQFKLEVVS